MPNRVVVTGLGVVAPNGIGKAAFWRSLLDGRSGIGPVSLFDPSGLPCRIAGEVRGFDPLQYMRPSLRPSKTMSRSAQFGVAAALMALEDAGLGPHDLPAGADIPISVGVSSSPLEMREQEPRPWFPVAGLPHAVTSAIHSTIGCPARLTTLSDGCASGVDAIGHAADEVRRGRSDLALAGAADSVMTRYVFECFAKSKKLSERNEEPEKADRPFDRDRDGGVISEAGGVMVLENAEAARARGAVPYCEIGGYGTFADPPGTPEGTGLERAMLMALANGARLPQDVDHVSAHGPGDRHMDAIESRLISKVLGARSRRIPVVSIKGATGNPMGVGGMLQAIAAAVSIREGWVPSTLNCDHPDVDCELDYVPGGPRRVDLATVLVNTHGFGRDNGALVLKRVESW